MPKEIVKIGDIVKFADTLARSIRARLVWSKKLRGKVRVSTAKKSGNLTTINIYIAEGDEDLRGMARAFEWGSGEKATRGGKRRYPIRVRNAPYLIFPGTNAFTGQIIKIKEVQHPGVAPRPFIAPAVAATRKRATKELAKAIRGNILEYLRDEMGKAVK